MKPHHELIYQAREAERKKDFPTAVSLLHQAAGIAPTPVAKRRIETKAYLLTKYHIKGEAKTYAI